MKDNFYLYDPGELKKYVEKNVIDNPIIQEFVKNHNKEQELDFESQVLGGCGVAFGRDDYILMLQLGIPIGIVQYIDSQGHLLIDEEDEPIGDVHYRYKPINSLEEYVKYMETDPFPNVMVNPNYMSKKEVRNIGYCLGLANSSKLFDFYTRSKLQFEIVKSVPLSYKDAMKIFNKYFDKSIQKKIIYKFKVERDRFYYLSGLEELIPPVKKRKKYERNER